jgi:acyl-CoA thioester hydrolase
MSQQETPRFGAATDRLSYPLWTYDKIRWRDCDSQGHVNNAVFATYLETGRVDTFRDPKIALLAPGETIVLVRIELDYRAELRYPGQVDIGLRVLSVGRSSFRFGQTLFSGDVCAATAEVVLVMMDKATRKAMPLTPLARTWLEEVQARQPLA